MTDDNIRQVAAKNHKLELEKRHMATQFAAAMLTTVRSHPDIPTLVDDAVRLAEALQQRLEPYP